MDEAKVRTEIITFKIVNINYPHTTIFSRGLTNKFDATIKQSYICMKIPSQSRILIVFGYWRVARETKSKHVPGFSLINQVESVDQQQPPDDKETLCNS